MPELDTLLKDIRACTLCAGSLPNKPRPVLQASSSAKILIAGHAPGRKVDASGIPFDDSSGDRLRSWLGLTREQFYDDRLVAVVPMGFCYPGTGKSGDLPPRPECAATWRTQLLARMPEVKMTILLGTYALKWHLGKSQKKNLTETVRNWPQYAVGGLYPLPHPSPRNNIWLKKNAWFETDCLPFIKQQVRGMV